MKIKLKKSDLRKALIIMFLLDTVLSRRVVSEVLGIHFLAEYETLVRRTKRVLESLEHDALKAKNQEQSTKFSEDRKFHLEQFRGHMQDLINDHADIQLRAPEVNSILRDYNLSGLRIVRS